MRTFLRPLMVVALVWGLVPGMSEATENLWHLVRTGHSAHDLSAGQGHAPHGKEHGCNGTFHLCSCHHSVPSDLVPALSPQRCGTVWEDLVPEERALRDGVSRPPERPPRLAAQS